MTPERLREALAKKQVVFGTWVQTPSAEVVEILGWAHTLGMLVPEGSDFDAHPAWFAEHARSISADWHEHPTPAPHSPRPNR